MTGELNRSVRNNISAFGKSGADKQEAEMSIVGVSPVGLIRAAALGTTALALVLSCGAVAYAAPASAPSEVGEVVVTAQKRAEKLQDVPSSISAMSQMQIERLAPNSMVDIASYVPGFAVQSGGSPGQTRYVLRGISTGNSSLIGGSTLVSTYIDDAPLGSSSSFAAAGAAQLDLVPYDIERVEVLRGPQGTLYGASGMGGVVKYVLRAPNLNRFEGRVGADVQQTDRANQPGWGVRGGLNVPIVDDVLGVRVSGFRRYSAGYIDNVGLGIKNENHYDQDGGRLAILWTPRPDVKIQASALLQDVDSSGNAAVSVDEVTRKPIYGVYSRSTLTPEYFRQQLRYYSLTGNWDLGFMTVTSASSWSQTRNVAGQDLTGTFGIFIPMLTDGAVSAGATPFSIETRLSKFTQELRLTSSSKPRLQWMVGVFYTQEDASNDQNLGALTTAGAAISSIDPLLTVNWPTKYKEISAFGELTYKFTDWFDVTGGFRYGNDDQTYHQELDGPLAGGLQVKDAKASESVENWMVSSRFHLNRDTMLYARVATGYRPGGPNVAILGVPPSYAPDKLINYEAGIKGNLFDRRLEFDLSAFYIDWSHIQIQVRNAQGLTYPGNGSGASSAGAEGTATYHVLEGLTLRGTLAYTDAHLTQDAPTLSGKAGDQLPMSPRWNGSIMVDYVHPLGDGRSVAIGAGYRYVGKVYNALPSAANPEPMPPQNIVDLYTEFVVDRVTARVFAKNVFNDHSYTSLLNNYHPTDPQFVLVQPRTVGVSVDYRF